MNKDVYKVPCWSTKAAISLKRVKIEQKILYTAFQKTEHTLLCLTNLANAQMWTNNLHKKLSYRRETARQLHTSFSAHSLIVHFT